MNFPVHKKYQVIYSDPPWAYGKAGSKIFNQATDHYECMPLEDIKNIPVKDCADKDCALFLWATNPKLPEAVELMKTWGFEYKTVFKVWRKETQSGKPVCNPGWWSRSSTELLLVGTIGHPLIKWKTTCSEPQEFASLRTVHSEKPHEIRDSVFNFLNVENRLEMFARKVFPDWDAWGNEIPGYFHETTGNSPNIVTDTHRTIGVQCDLIFNQGKKKTKEIIRKDKSTKCGGVSHHKPDCNCFICKKNRINNNHEHSSSNIREQGSSIQANVQEKS